MRVSATLDIQEGEDGNVTSAPHLQPHRALLPWDAEAGLPSVPVCGPAPCHTPGIPTAQFLWFQRAAWTWEGGRQNCARQSAWPHAQRQSTHSPAGSSSLFIISVNYGHLSSQHLFIIVTAHIKNIDRKLKHEDFKKEVSVMLQRGVKIQNTKTPHTETKHKA